MCDQAAISNKSENHAPSFLKQFKGENEDQEANHTCHRHWAFALYKKGDMSKACKLIKKAI